MLFLNNLNLSNDSLNALLGMAGKKLGQDPAALKQQLESGNLNGLLSSLDPNAQAQINQALQNPKQIEALLGDQKVKNMLSNLMGGKK